jgi:hypothetical protein
LKLRPRQPQDGASEGSFSENFVKHGGTELPYASLEQKRIHDLGGFERGLRAGVFLRDILEHLDFQAADQIDQLAPSTTRSKLPSHPTRTDSLTEGRRASQQLRYK